MSAYYHSKSSFSFLGTAIGNFDGGTSDIEIRIYAENDQGRYNLIKNVPQIGYFLNSSKIDCPSPAHFEATSSTITVSSTEKVTCRFYYDKLSDKDIELFIMLEDSEGDVTHNGTKYKQSEKIPAYGYSFDSYTCSDPGVVTSVDYNADTREFIFDTSAKNTCYAYFKNNIIPDLNVDVYIQDGVGSNGYLKVESIPGVLTYKKSTVKTSSCVDRSGNPSSTTVDYVNGEILISGQSPGKCTLYLDING